MNVVNYLKLHEYLTIIIGKTDESAASSKKKVCPKLAVFTRWSTTKGGLKLEERYITDVAVFTIDVLCQP